jgi:hypothetical protein
MEIINPSAQKFCPFLTLPILQQNAVAMLGAGCMKERCEFYDVVNKKCMIQMLYVVLLQKYSQEKTV